MKIVFRLYLQCGINKIPRPTLLMISSGSGFRIRTYNLPDDFVCEYPVGSVSFPKDNHKSHMGERKNALSCKVKGKKFTLYTNLLKQKQASVFYSAANNFCKEKGGSLAMPKTREEQKGVIAFVRGKGRKVLWAFGLWGPFPGS